MDVLCVGMYRSGSTWQYLVSSVLVERHLGGQRIGFLDGEHFALHERTCAAARGPHVLKAHDAHPSFAAALDAGRALAVYSYRDLRDVAFSLAHKYATSFEEVVERRGFLHVSLANDAFWMARPRTLCQRYEDLVEAPVKAIEDLAAHLGVVLEAGEAEALAACYSLDANRSRTAELAARLRARGVALGSPDAALARDECTQLHWNHIRSGRIGGWRGEATPRQLAVLAEICGAWLVAHAYEPDDRWLLPAITAVRAELEAKGRTARQLRAELDQIGPLGRRVARWARRFELRHPRLWSAARRVVRPVGKAGGTTDIL